MIGRLLRSIGVWRVDERSWEDEYLNLLKEDFDRETFWVPETAPEEIRERDDIRVYSQEDIEWLAEQFEGGDDARDGE